MLQLIIAVPAACLPVALAVVVIWWLDRYDREPIALMLAALMWGATFAIGLGILGSLILGAIFIGGGDAEQTVTVTQAVWIAPFVEEIAKIMIFGVLFFLKDFDNATDGFVYGATAGLGFAMTENILYFSGAELEGLVGLIFLRTFFTAPMHAVASATLGACIGHVKYTRSWLLFLFLPCFGFVLAWGIHTSWNNFMISYAYNEGEHLFALGILCLLFEIGLAFSVFMASLYFESRTLLHELAEEAHYGVLPPEHPPILASYFKRRRSDWSQGIKDPGAYVSAATTLAFRKQQWRNSSDEKRTGLDADIKKLREELQKLRGGRGGINPHRQGPQPPGYPYPQAGQGQAQWNRWNPY